MTRHRKDFSCISMDRGSAFHQHALSSSESFVAGLTTKTNFQKRCTADGFGRTKQLKAGQSRDELSTNRARVLGAPRGTLRPTQQNFSFSERVRWIRSVSQNAGLGRDWHDLSRHSGFIPVLSIAPFIWLSRARPLEFAVRGVAPNTNHTDKLRRARVLAERKAALC